MFWLEERRNFEPYRKEARNSAKKWLADLKQELKVLQKEKNILGEKFFECENDSDCAWFDTTSCGCSGGGIKEPFANRAGRYKEITISIYYFRRVAKTGEHGLCPQWYRCSEFEKPLKCENKKCVVSQ
jgi:hypothetical protein